MTDSIEPLDEHRQSFPRVDLVDVVVQSFSATLKRLDNVEGLHLAIGTSWAIQGNALLCRFSAECFVYDATIDDNDEAFANDHLLAELRCRIVCEYDVVESELEFLSQVDPRLVEAFAALTALPVAFPYIREAISSMSTRLGFPRVTLGTFRPNEDMTFATKAL